ncbi:hypothetical protein MASR1M12_45090 [Erysipelotrichia bacterium]
MKRFLYFAVLLVLLILVLLKTLPTFCLCPLSHYLNPDYFCRVCDQYQGRILVEHFDRDTGIVRLSINNRAGKRMWISHPINEGQNFDSKITNNKIQFSRQNSSEIEFNGRLYSIKEVSSTKEILSER